MDRNDTYVLEQAYRDAFAILRAEIEQLRAEASVGSDDAQELDPKAVQRLRAYRTYLSARDALFARLQNDRTECFTAAVGY
jgi:hypothetical protein